MQKEPEENAGVGHEECPASGASGRGPQDIDPQQQKAREKREEHRTLIEVTRVNKT